ncbi:MAG: 2-polyprenyl-3-methyl-5-hydroxy-6-metoxy,4-benzoquinol methylase [Blastococcus sp.]|nr:2-polyprenyl-3-methyl-5-hydroxy-6-metoxy,4-benzoquinol methylase [Blastococcus sp.]
MTDPHTAHDSHGALLTVADRHDHEARIYDAMAAGILAGWSESDYRVDPGAIPFVNREQVDYLAAAVEQLGPLAGRRILEVGAGGGSLAVWLAQQGATVVGIDVSDGILQVARERARVNGVADRVTLVHSPIETFDPRAAGLDHDTYDAVIGNNVVHHFERVRALDNLARLLAPGALAVFCEPVLFVPEWMRSLRNSRAVTRRFPAHTHTPDERALTDADFALMRGRFRHVEWRPFQVLCRLQNFVELSDRTWLRLEGVDRWLLQVVPGTRRICRIAVVTLGLPRSSGRAMATEGAPLASLTEGLTR